jgi:Concanavalin A-like lectin/glucanases superfamily
MAAVHPAERASVRSARGDSAPAPSATIAPPSPSDHVLALQRRAGNQAVAATIVRRDKGQRSSEPGPHVLLGRAFRSYDPDDWIRRFVATAKKRGWDAGVGVLLTVAHNAAYAFNTDGSGRREIAMHLGNDLRDAFVWRVDVTTSSWSAPGSALTLHGDGTWKPPLPETAIKSLCEALGFAYRGPRSLWVLLDVEPDVSFALPRGVQPAENTPALQRKARQIADELVAIWRRRGVNPKAFSLEAWFKTSTKHGGGIIGLSAEPGPVANPNRDHDRHVYVRDDGRVSFGVYHGQSIETTAQPYNDGKWHQVVAVIGAAGQKLYLDGTMVASSVYTTVEDYQGYWHIGCATMDFWPDKPASDYLAGTVDEVAVYTTELRAPVVAEHYCLARRLPDASAPPA